eukprot:Opistho-2@93726
MASVVSFSSLPLEIVVHHIAPFLGNVDLSSLSKVNSSLHAHLRHVRLFHLWPMYNRKYIEDSQFRDEVRATIPVDRLVLVSFDGDLQDLSAFKGVHSALFLIRGRTGSTCSASDLSPLKGVHTVELSFHSESPDFLTPLANAQVVRITELNCFIKVPTFRKAKSVDIRNGRLDLNDLTGIPRVTLGGGYTEPGTRFQDVSPLRLARFVELRSQKELEDLSCLESAREVVIHDCPRIVTLPPATYLRAFTWHDSPLTAIPPELGKIAFPGPLVC